MHLIKVYLTLLYMHDYIDYSNSFHCTNWIDNVSLISLPKSSNFCIKFYSFNIYLIKNYLKQKYRKIRKNGKFDKIFTRYNKISDSSNDRY